MSEQQEGQPSSQPTKRELVESAMGQIKNLLVDRHEGPLKGVHRVFSIPMINPQTGQTETRGLDIDFDNEAETVTLQNVRTRLSKLYLDYSPNAEERMGDFLLYLTTPPEDTK